MATERQRRMGLGVVLVVLAFVLYRAWASVTPSEAPGSSSNTRARGAKSDQSGEAPATAPDVRLESLDDERPQPADGNRNLFRFKPTAPPPRPAPPPPPVGRPVPTVPAGPTGPPAPPPIPLKFIGILEAPGQAKRIAALVDSTGRSFGGGEGDIIAGQYRILKIGVESIEVAYLDGRGRQTIRLSGS
jgi:hypothetical protein